jgi:hypothetical protein
MALVNHRPGAHLILSLLGGVLLACAGSPPAPAAPAEPPAATAPAGSAVAPEPTPAAAGAGATRAETESTDTSEPVDAADSTGAADANAADDTGAAAEPAPAEKPPRPGETITATGVIFMLDYQGSDVAEAAKKKCGEEAGDDMDKRAECLERERDGFKADALRFKQKRGADEVRWIIYRRDGGALKEVHNGRYQFAGESAKSVDLKLKGGAMGARPLFAGRSKITLSVPSTYRLIINDPRYGRLVYKARFESGAQ